MKKYYIALIALTTLLVLVSFCTLWFAHDIFQVALPLLPIYFAVVTGIQHYAIVKSFFKDPRTFVKNFLAITVGSLFLHLIVLFAWSLTHIHTAKIFILGFCICYAAYLVFETIALILVVKQERTN